MWKWRLEEVAQTAPDHRMCDGSGPAVLQCPSASQRLWSLPNSKQWCLQGFLQPCGTPFKLQLKQQKISIRGIHQGAPLAPRWSLWVLTVSQERQVVTTTCAHLVCPEDTFLKEKEKLDSLSYNFNKQEAMCLMTQTPALSHTCCVTLTNYLPSLSQSPHLNNGD